MRIVRQRSPERFTVVDNDVLEDERISFRARGVLGFLLSKPDGWETSSERLAACSPGEGRDAVRTALRELEAVGYLARTRRQDATTGRWSTVTAIIDRPTPENPSSGIRRLENRPSDSQALLVSTQPNTPPPTPAGSHPVRRPEEEVPPEVLSAIDSVDALCDQLRSSRSAAGLTTARWTNRLVCRALRKAYDAGFDPALMSAALHAIAADRATATPGRLPHDGPWWDAAGQRARPTATVAPIGCRHCDFGWITDSDGLPVDKCPHCHPAARRSEGRTA